MKNTGKKLIDRFGFIPLIRNYHQRWHLFGRAGFGLLTANNIFRKIFRINSDVDFPIHFTSRIIAYKKMKINADATTIGSFVLSGSCYFQALNGIEIGENFLFAPGLKIISSNHGRTDRSLVEKAPPVVIGNNVWVGAGVIILPGVRLGDHVIVGAGSVVTKSFPQNVTIAGNPARIIQPKSSEVN